MKLFDYQRFVAVSNEFRFSRARIFFGFSLTEAKTPRVAGSEYLWYWCYSCYRWDYAWKRCCVLGIIKAAIFQGRGTKGGRLLLTRANCQ